MLGYQNQNKMPNTDQNQTQTQPKTRPTLMVVAASRQASPGHLKPQQLAPSYRTQDEPARISTIAPGNGKAT